MTVSWLAAPGFQGRQCIGQGAASNAAASVAQQSLRAESTRLTCRHCEQATGNHSSDRHTHIESSQPQSSLSIGQIRRQHLMASPKLVLFLRLLLVLMHIDDISHGLNIFHGCSEKLVLWSVASSGPVLPVTAVQCCIQAARVHPAPPAGMQADLSSQGCFMTVHCFRFLLSTCCGEAHQDSGVLCCSPASVGEMAASSGAAPSRAGRARPCLLSKLSVGSSAQKALPVSHLLGSELDFTSSSSKPVVREAARLDNCSQSPSIMNYQAHSGKERQTHGEVPACLKLLQQMAPSPQYFSSADGLVCKVLHKSLTRKQGMCRPPGRLRARFALRPDTSADHGTSVGSLYRLPICSGSRLVQDSY